jgi:hypothetical protein
MNSPYFTLAVYVCVREYSTQCTGYGSTVAWLVNIIETIQGLWKYVDIGINASILAGHHNICSNEICLTFRFQFFGIHTILICAFTWQITTYCTNI